MNNKTVAIIGTVGLPAAYGGFETLAENLTRHLGNNIDMTVFCSSKAYTEKRENYNGAKLVYLPLKANGLQSIPYDVLAILKSLRRADVMLILGVSGCAALPVIRPFYRGKIIVNIDGLEWKRDKWNGLARRFLKFSESIAVSFADVVVADNKVIQQHVMDTYNKSSALIAYGADHVSTLPLDDKVLQQFPFLQQPYAFSVCRIEPENNIHIILEAIANLPQLQLVLVGNWQASDYGSNLQKNFSQYNNLHLIDPIYDQNILNRIRSNCWIYLHGHSAGGTNPSLVEAMYLKLPVIAFDVNYNRETTENQAIYFSDAEQLGSILADINNIDILGIAEHMHSIAWRRYRWQVIAEEYAALF